MAIFRAKSNLGSDQAVSISLNGSILKSSQRLYCLHKDASDYSENVILKASIMHAFG